MKKLTIAAPCFNEELGIAQFVDALRAVGSILEQKGLTVRFLLIDDGSADCTLAVLNNKSRQDPRLQVLSFSRNFGHQAAIAAAIDMADCDALIIMDSDLQHPPELIPDMVRSWEEGYDVVSMIRVETVAQSLLKKVTSKLFYRAFNSLSDTKVPLGAADFLLLSRNAYEALRLLPEYHQFWRGLVSWIGFNRTFIEYTAAQRAVGESKYSVTKMIRFAINGLASFSSRPMKAIIGIGLLTVGFGAVYLLYALFRKLFLNDTVPGWSSIIAAVIVIGGIQIVVTGVIGSYTAKIFEQTKNRPRYLFKQGPKKRPGLDELPPPLATSGSSPDRT